MNTVGIDIGGTKIAGALVSDTGAIIRELRVPTPAQDSDALIQAIIAMVNDLRAGEQVDSVGVAAAGFIDADQSTVVYAPNLSWRNEPLKARLEEKLGLTVVIENDANAAGWAEYRFGAGRGSKHMLMLTVGTGVGGAIVANGQLFRGGFGIGAELGHFRFIPEGKICGCGQKGCLEQYGSGTALLNSAKELIATGDPKGARLKELAELAGELSGTEVYQAIQEGDAASLELLDQLGSNLGIAVASLVAVLDPEVVVIGGGVSAAGELLLAPIRKAYLEHLPAKGFRPELKLVVAELVNDAGVVGAADLAREHSAGR
ncbi:MAG: ROK family protein [Micrococcales bacterium]|nr:ROK family protein [Actinomycetota bacterium]NCA07284.1 ROK family protein [Micrococcales bacterium]